jgi:hypothetical protein
MRRRNVWLGAGAVAVVMVAIGCSRLFRGQPVAAITSYAQCTTAGYPFTDTNPSACTADGRTFLDAAAAPSAAPVAVTNLPFDLLVDGDSDGNYPKRQQVIRTETGWEQYWRQVHAALSTVPPILPVDFSISNVVALSEGGQLTQGYVLEITGVDASAAGTTIDVTESIPTLTCQVSNTPSNRYYIIRTPKLTSPVSFRTTTAYRQCAQD